MINPPGCLTVLIGGMPAARVGDMATCTMPPPAGPHGVVPIIPPGCLTVLIGGMPAARMGDMCGCSAPIVMGAMNVLIGG
jgi:uncharacterized Zn-binding protein involved in type VI secretion